MVVVVYDAQPVETMAERMESEPSCGGLGDYGSCTLSTSGAPSMASMSGLARGEKSPTPS